MKRFIFSKYALGAYASLLFTFSSVDILYAWKIGNIENYYLLIKMLFRTIPYSILIVYIFRDDNLYQVPLIRTHAPIDAVRWT